MERTLVKMLLLPVNMPTIWSSKLNYHLISIKFCLMSSTDVTLFTRYPLSPVYKISLKLLKIYLQDLKISPNDLKIYPKLIKISQFETLIRYLISFVDISDNFIRLRYINKHFKQKSYWHALEFLYPHQEIRSPDVYLKPVASLVGLLYLFMLSSPKKSCCHNMAKNKLL